MSNWFEKGLKAFWEWWNLTKLAGSILLLLGLLGAIEGGIPYPSFLPKPIVNLHRTMGTELIGIGVTVLIIESANEYRQQREIINHLIRQMASVDNGIARQAVKELRALNKVEDGTLRNSRLAEANLRETILHRADLRGADLRWVNLERANLQFAKLQEANLFKANLYGAHLHQSNLSNVKEITESQLAQCNTLWRAIMPEGEMYDGRYRLAGEIYWAQKQGIDINDPNKMARYYGISLNVYEKGQEWAEKNLSKLRDEKKYVKSYQNRLSEVWGESWEIESD